jgi:hypothetical protein
LSNTKLPSPYTWIHLIGIFLLGGALSLNPLRSTRAFFSDEAVYYTMAYSFAYDGDMEYQRKDLLRVYKEYPSGPTGIILKLNERDHTIVFGKGFLYSLAAAPFVRLFHTNGFLVLHAILVWLNLLCAYRFCSAFMEKGSALLFSFFYFLANASFVYFYWMTPEYFNMSLLCYAVFFFVAEKIQSPRIIFRAPYNYFLSAILFGLATYAKPPNALVVIPLGLWLLFSKKKEKPRRALIHALIALALFIFATLAMFGWNVYFTGDWNYQGGRRAAFYRSYPFEHPAVSEFSAFERKDAIKAMVAPPFYSKTFLYNWPFFFFGRYSGVAIYFFPMFFCLLFYLFTKKSSLSWAVYIAAWLGLLYYLIGLPWNYFGGSGTIGNRYLLSVFAVFLFAIMSEPPKRLMLMSFLASVAFTGVILFSPLFSSHRNAFHQQFSLFRFLPVEDSLLSDLPVNASFRATRVAFTDPATYFVYFLDDNTFYREAYENVNGFWAKGGKKADFVVRTFKPNQKIQATITSLTPNNHVSVKCGDKTTVFEFQTAGTQKKEIPLAPAFPYDRDGTGATYLYNFTVEPASGMVKAIDGYPDRYLGAFIKLDVF